MVLTRIDAATVCVVGVVLCDKYAAALTAYRRRLVTALKHANSVATTHTKEAAMAE